MSQQQKLIIVVFFMLVSLFVSLNYTGNQGTFTQQPREKLDIYSNYAWNVVMGNGYQDCVITEEYVCDPMQPTDRTPNHAYRLPVYPLFIAGVMAIDIDNFIPLVIVLQSVFVSAIVGISVGWASQWHRSGMIITGGILLLTLPMYEMASLLMTEILFTLLLLIFTYGLSKAVHDKQYFMLGLLLGIIMLTRGVLLFTLPLLFLWMRPKRHFLILIIGMVCVITPWAIRNYTVFNTFVPFSTGSGQVLSGANNPTTFSTAPGTWLSYTWEDSPPSLSEVEDDKFRRNRTIEYLRSLDLRDLFASIFLKMFSLIGIYDNYRWSISVFINFAILMWTLYQCLRKIRVRYAVGNVLKQPTFTLYAVLIIGLIANTLIFWGGWRFRLPYEPYLAIISGILLSTTLNKMRPSKFLQ